MDRELQRQLAFAEELARAAGEVLRRGYRRAVSVSFKGEIDLMTDTDKRSERLILRRIRAAWPVHAVLAEESGEHGKGDSRWFVDPLDGTTNFAHKYPCFGVSLALERRGQMLLGVVYDPLRDELFSAARGGGARLNGRRIRVSGERRLSRSLLATGFPYERAEKVRQVAHFRAFIGAAQAVRRDGSAALDLAYLACGRYDGFWEHSLHPWDTAAGMVLVEEAGGRLSDFRGGAFQPFLKECVASNGHIHGQMLRVLKKR